MQVLFWKELVWQAAPRLAWSPCRWTSWTFLMSANLARHAIPSLASETSEETYIPIYINYSFYKQFTFRITVIFKNISKSSFFNNSTRNKRRYINSCSNSTSLSTTQQYHCSQQLLQCHYSFTHPCSTQQLLQCHYSFSHSCSAQQLLQNPERFVEPIFPSFVRVCIIKIGGVKIAQGGLIKTVNHIQHILNLVEHCVTVRVLFLTVKRLENRQADQEYCEKLRDVHLSTYEFDILSMVVSRVKAKLYNIHMSTVKSKSKVIQYTIYICQLSRVKAKLKTS